MSLHVHDAQESPLEPINFVQTAKPVTNFAHCEPFSQDPFQWLVDPPQHRFDNRFWSHLAANRNAFGRQVVLGAFTLPYLRHWRTLDVSLFRTGW